MVQHTRGRKQKEDLVLAKHHLKQPLNHLIENCHFGFGNVTMKQVIGIPTGIDPAPFWGNLFLHSCEEEYMSPLISYDKIKARHFH